MKCQQVMKQARNTFPVIATLRCLGWNRYSGKNEGTGESQVKMGRLVEDKFREFKERTEKEKIRSSEGEDVGLKN